MRISDWSSDVCSSDLIRGPSGFQLLQLVDMRSTDQAAAQSVTQYRARHILVREDGDGDAAAAKARIDTLRARIAGGADFAEVAKEESDDTFSKDKGGDRKSTSLNSSH